MEARQFLSCVARLAQRHQRFGAAYIIDILRGARTERVLSGGHDALSVYGIGKHRRVDEWRNLARALLHQGLIEESQDGYSVLSLNAQSWPVLRGERAREHCPRGEARASVSDRRSRIDHGRFAVRALAGAAQTARGRERACRRMSFFMIPPCVRWQNTCRSISTNSPRCLAWARRSSLATAGSSSPRCASIARGRRVVRRATDVLPRAAGRFRAALSARPRGSWRRGCASRRFSPWRSRSVADRSRRRTIRDVAPCSSPAYP